MAGSREGWIEARYLACPCTLSTLSHALVQAPGAMQALIAPGLYSQDARGIHDVLRGEETQILGAQDGEDAWFITPGTHSKWVEFRNGAITKFHTYMTGEFFRLLASHSVLSRTLDPNGVFDPDAFENGVTRGLAGGALSKIAFAVRAEALFNVLAPPAAASYLSGLLIGAEIADGLSLSNGNRLVLIGARKIADLYLKALRLAGVSDVVVVDGEAASARGLWSIAKEVSP